MPESTIKPIPQYVEYRWITYNDTVDGPEFYYYVSDEDLMEQNDMEQNNYHKEEDDEEEDWDIEEVPVELDQEEDWDTEMELHAANESEAEVQTKQDGNETFTET